MKVYLTLLILLCLGHQAYARSAALPDGICIIRTEGQTGQGFIIDETLVTAAHVVAGPIKWISCLQHGEWVVLTEKIGGLPLVYKDDKFKQESDINNAAQDLALFAVRGRLLTSFELADETDDLQLFSKFGQNVQVWKIDMRKLMEENKLYMGLESSSDLSGVKTVEKDGESLAMVGRAADVDIYSEENLPLAYGDSGSPLFFAEVVANRWKVIGIMSQIMRFKQTGADGTETEFKQNQFFPITRLNRWRNSQGFQQKLCSTLLE